MTDSRALTLITDGPDMARIRHNGIKMGIPIGILMGIPMGTPKVPKCLNDRKKYE